MIRKIVLVACLCAITSPVESKIAFYSNRDGNFEIYTMNSDGSNQIQLTFNDAADSYPVWCPDGLKIAFTSDRDGNIEVYVMTADGTNQRNLTNHPANDRHPDWSPDGSRIVFSSKRDVDGPPTSLFMMDADGRNVTKIPQWRLAVQPKWSPDGTQIAFGRYVANSEGRAPWLVERSHEDKEMILEGWFPDGTRILYSERQLASDKDTLVIGTLNPFKRSVIRWRRVSVPSKFKMIYHSAAFSSDGKSILFAGNRIDDRDWDIYRFRLSDRRLIQLTDSPGDDLAPQEWDSRLSVSPGDLNPTLWGKIKANQ